MVRTVAALATVHAVDVWILRLDAAWQFVVIVAVTSASAHVDRRSTATVEGHHV